MRLCVSLFAFMLGGTSLNDYQEYLKKLNEKIIYLCLIALVVLIPSSHYAILALQNYPNLIINCIYVITLIMSGSFLITRVQGGLSFNNKKYQIIIGILMLFGLLSTFMSIDRNLSIFGVSGRFEGILTLLSYYLIFLCSSAISEHGRKKRLIQIFLSINVLHSIYGLCQYFNLFQGIVINKYGASISGVAGNPNFMGSLLVLSIGLSAGLFYCSKTIKDTLIYLCATIIFFITMLLTNTMSALLGIGAIAILFLLIMIKTFKYYKENRVEKINSFSLLIAAIILGSVLLIGVNVATQGKLLDKLFVSIQDFAGIISGVGITEETATGRFVVWGNALKLVPQYWLFGSGPDTFMYAYHESFGTTLGQYFDKAHNEYIQVLITQGIPVLLMMIILYGNIVIDGLKKIFKMVKTKIDIEFDGLYLGLIVAVFGYMVQAIFNISVIDVAPYFWMCLGLIAGWINNDPKEVKLF